VIYVTGGASWGDAPTDPFEHFRDSSLTGPAQAAGFHIEPDFSDVASTQGQPDSEITRPTNESRHGAETPTALAYSTSSIRSSQSRTSA